MRKSRVWTVLAGSSSGNPFRVSVVADHFGEAVTTFMEVLRDHCLQHSWDEKNFEILEVKLIENATCYVK